LQFVWGIHWGHSNVFDSPEFNYFFSRPFKRFDALKRTLNDRAGACGQAEKPALPRVTILFTRNRCATLAPINPSTKLTIAMKTLQFSTTIQAPAITVYRAMLGLDDISTYQQWTSVYNPTSTYRGSWDKGSKIQFIGTSEDGTTGGMVSQIVDNIPGQFVSIRHIGIVSGDQEITSGPEVEAWAGGLENYTFEEYAGITTVTIALDTAPEFESYFSEASPKSLELLKELVER
jgi:hypothetical protein